MRWPSTSPNTSLTWPMPRLAPNGPPARRNGIGGGSTETTNCCCPVPGMAPVTASVIRGFLADGTAFASGKAAASYVGLNPSTWSSGTVSQPSRAITKEGPAVLRLAFFQAANAARRQDPQLAGFYHQLMTEHGHCHTQACVAVARKLVERTWTVLNRGTPYQIRDLDGQPISRLEAKKMIKQVCTVPDQVRAKARAHSAATNRAKLTR